MQIEFKEDEKELMMQGDKVYTGIFEGEQMLFFCVNREHVFTIGSDKKLMFSHAQYYEKECIDLKDVTDQVKITVG